MAQDAGDFEAQATAGEASDATRAMLVEQERVMRQQLRERANAMDRGAIAEQFRYHAPRPDQVPRYERLRDGARGLAELIVELCPPSADRTAALRKLRECVMTANASIALED